MSKELHKKILSDLSARTEWEQFQRVWYEIRNQGLRRKNKPFPGASDLHFPLADSIIEKTKPFYAQQLVSQELLASFISYKPQSEELTSAAARWFDYKLRHESDFILEQLYAVDIMLQSNKGILKVYWDAKARRLGFDAIEPIAIIVPKGTKRLKDADRVCQVIQMSVEQYKLDETYSQNPELIGRLKGRAEGNDGVDAAMESERDRREGITSAESDDDIVIWEVWEREKEGWMVHWFSPKAPEEPIRPSQRNVYKHAKLPFVEFHMEIKGKGYYDPRGVTEIVAPFEISTCKMWNEKHDFMAFVNRPLFTSQRPLPNAGQLTMRPGAILPYGLERLDMGNPPFAMDQEIAFNRQTAEQRIGQPDYALSRAGGSGGKDPRTATEIEQVSQMSMQSVDLRAIIFRLSATEVYEQAWELLLQYDQSSEYLGADGQFTELPGEVREGKYKIHPSGSVDSWNKTLQMQKATLRWQMFNNDPYINQGELRKSLLTLDDPQLVRTLYQEPEQAMAVQAEAQATEIMLMLGGWPAAIEQQDDDVTHIRTIAQYMQKRAMTGEATPPETTQLLQQHMQGHMQKLAASGPDGRKKAQAAEQEVAGILQQTQQMLAQAQQHPQLPPNVMPMARPQPQAI